MTPTKENTLYLVIKQVYFDAILAGTMKQEFREIKSTTYEKFLETQKENGKILGISFDESKKGNLTETDLFLLHISGLDSSKNKQKMFMN